MQGRIMQDLPLKVMDLNYMQAQNVSAESNLSIVGKHASVPDIDPATTEKSHNTNGRQELDDILEPNLGIGCS